jgi:hypothetical protein
MGEAVFPQDARIVQLGQLRHERRALERRADDAAPVPLARRITGTGERQAERRHLHHQPEAETADNRRRLPLGAVASGLRNALDELRLALLGQEPWWNLGDAVIRRRSVLAFR